MISVASRALRGNRLPKLGELCVLSVYSGGSEGLFHSSASSSAKKNNHMGYVKDKYKGLRLKPGQMLDLNDNIVTLAEDEDDEKSVEQLAVELDTTLTPEALERANKLKKSIRGGANSKRSLYREVPNAEEMELINAEAAKFSNYVPKQAPNAEAIITYALSLVPERGGPRRSRHKKRMEHRRVQISKESKKRQRENRKAQLAKQAKAKKLNDKVKEYKELAKQIRAKLASGNSSNVNSSS